MTKVTTLHRERERKRSKEPAARNDRFLPCDPDMTICGDCEGNRAKNKCPRQKEWLAKRKS